MAKFRSKPVEIEAVQLTRQRAFDWDNGVERKPNGVGAVLFGGGVPVSAMCASRQGPVPANISDWLIQESDGSGCYPCKPDVFEAKYEPV